MDRERQACPECNGSGVYQEYDEFDRYTVHSCATCDGSGEIDRQSVTSEEVQRAIEFWEKIKRQSIRCIKQSQNGKSYQVNLLPTLDNAYALDLAIAALRQYQKPTDEKIRRAIEWQESSKEVAQIEWDLSGEEEKSEPGASNLYQEQMAAFDLAIQALRRMRTEPCEWCKSKNIRVQVNQKHGEYDFDTGKEVSQYWTWDVVPHSYCPNCGRYIGGAK